MTNVEFFVDRGMISETANVSSEQRELLNSLTVVEVEQLVGMWERLERPSPEEFADLACAP